MTRQTPTPTEAQLVRQVRLGLQKLAERHGNPHHVGAGMFLDGETPGTLFIYMTNSGVCARQELVLETDPLTHMMFHAMPQKEVQLLRAQMERTHG